MKDLRTRRGAAGFTLIELLVVIIIISILATVVALFSHHAVAKAQMAVAKDEMMKLGHVAALATTQGVLPQGSTTWNAHEAFVPTSGVEQSPSRPLYMTADNNGYCIVETEPIQGVYLGVTSNAAGVSEAATPADICTGATPTNTPANPAPDTVGAPTDLAYDASTSLLTWAAPSGTSPTEYRVRIYNLDDLNTVIQTETITTGPLQVEVTGSPSDAFEAEIVAATATTSSDPATLRFEIPMLSGWHVANATAQNITITSATIVADATPGADAVECRYRIDPTSTFGPYTWMTAAGTINAQGKDVCSITGLFPSVKYDFRVIESATGKVSGTTTTSADNDTVGTFWTSDGSEYAPTNLKLVSQTYTTLTATWDAPAQPVTKYVVLYAIAGTLNFQDVVIAPDSNGNLPATYTITGLTNGVQYDVKVQGIVPATSYGNTYDYASDSSMLTGLVGFKLSDIEPSNIQASSPTYTTMAVTWDKPALDVDQYIVEYSPANQNAWQTQYVSGTSLSTTLTGLSPSTYLTDTYYDVRVSAMKAGRQSSYHLTTAKMTFGIMANITWTFTNSLGSNYYVVMAKTTTLTAAQYQASPSTYPTSAWSATSRTRQVSFLNSDRTQTIYQVYKWDSSAKTLTRLTSLSFTALPWTSTYSASGLTW